MAKLKAGVVGVGHLGYHHARHYHGLSAAELVAIADTDMERGKNVSADFGVTAFADYRQLAPLVDVVSVAVPTNAHYEVTRFFLERKKHVLLEKPIAVRLEEADILIQLSEQNGVVLQVGHSERFNGAVQQLRKRLNRPMFIESHRLAPFSLRGCDVNVVLDLMIHDLDIILSLLKSPVKEVIDAVGVPLISDSEDIANARLLFENGCIANVTASRISAEPMRKIRIFQPFTYFSLDYAAQAIKCFQLNKAAGADLSQALLYDEIAVEKEEPLRKEIEAFVSSVHEGAAPAVTGREAREALAVAAQIIEKMRSRTYQ